MDRIGHQYIGVHATALPALMIFQPVEVVLAVVRCEKAGLAVVSALNEMQRYAGKRKTGAAGHRSVRCMWMQ